MAKERLRRVSTRLCGVREPGEGEALPSDWTGLSSAAPALPADSGPAAAARRPACWPRHRPAAPRPQGRRCRAGSCTSRSCPSAGACLCREHVRTRREILSRHPLRKHKCCPYVQAKPSPGNPARERAPSEQPASSPETPVPPRAPTCVAITQPEADEAPAGSYGTPHRGERDTPTRLLGLCPETGTEAGCTLAAHGDAGRSCARPPRCWGHANTLHNAQLCHLYARHRPCVSGTSRDAGDTGGRVGSTAPWEGSVPSPGHLVRRGPSLPGLHPLGTLGCFALICPQSKETKPVDPSVSALDTTSACCRARLRPLLANGYLGTLRGPGESADGFRYARPKHQGDLQEPTPHGLHVRRVREQPHRVYVVRRGVRGPLGVPGRPPLPRS